MAVPPDSAQDLSGGTGETYCGTDGVTLALQYPSGKTSPSFNGIGTPQSIYTDDANDTCDWFIDRF